MDHLKRSADQAGLSLHGQPPAKTSRADVLVVDPSVRAKLHTMIATGVINEGDLDDRALNQLNEFASETANEILEQMCSTDLRNVRNKSAYLCGVMNRYRKSGYGSSLPNLAAASVAIPPHLLYPAVMPQAPVPGVVMPQYVLPPAPMLPPALKPVPASMLGRRNYGADQARLGVRVNEFHLLSEDFAQYVAPAAALRLQELWDSGVKLVSLLDERAWEALAMLGPNEGLAVIDEIVAKDSGPVPVRNINAMFMTCAKPWLERARGAKSGAGTDAATSSSRPPNAPTAPNFDALPSGVQRRILDMLDTYTTHLHPNHFDEGVCDSFLKISESDVMSVLDEISRNDMGSIRNIPGYIMGICKRFRLGVDPRRGRD